MVILHIECWSSNELNCEGLFGRLVVFDFWAKAG